MAAGLIRILIRQLAKRVVREGIDQALDPDSPLRRTVDEVSREIFGQDGRQISEETDQENAEMMVERVLDESVNRGRVSPREIEDRTMVDFNTFMSVALTQCGSDRRTFRQLTDLWNREKETIQAMTVSELRGDLVCP